MNLILKLITLNILIFTNYFFESLIGEGTKENSSFVNFLLNFFVAMTGLLVSSIVIGIIVQAITDRIESIRNGTGFIDEKNHQLVLGWSSGIDLVFKVFLLANENQKNSNIVFMDNINPVEANQRIMSKFPDKKDYLYVQLIGNCFCGSSLFFSWFRIYFLTKNQIEGDATQ